MEQLKSILTQTNYYPIARKGCASIGNPYVYLKPLNKVQKILIEGYDGSNMVIVDDSKEKHVCNEIGNYIITKNIYFSGCG